MGTDRYYDNRHRNDSSNFPLVIIICGGKPFVSFLFFVSKANTRKIPHRTKVKSLSKSNVKIHSKILLLQVENTRLGVCGERIPEGYLFIFPSFPSQYCFLPSLVLRSSFSF
uniref:Uncharacterized protein n=1 Tax=Cacopsylla melanoneura TaxID=428564 RepID=A0A8D9BYY0_9HEMI